MTAKRAFATIRIVAKAALDGEIAVNYSELAQRLEMPNETGRGLGAILDEAAARCNKRGLPNVAVFVVTKHSLENGHPMPSEGAFDSAGFWPVMGLRRDQIPDEQDRIRTFDWLAVRELGLGK